MRTKYRAESAPPDTRMQRTRSSPSAPRSPLTRHPFAGVKSALGSRSRHFAPAFAAVIALVLAAGCARSTQCTVENRSSSALTHIVISGVGFTTPVPDLAPGASAVVSLRPRGEAGNIRIAFEAGGREHRHSVSVYFEARGYALLVRVDPQFGVAVQVSLARVVPSPPPAPFEGASEQRVAADSLPRFYRDRSPWTRHPLAVRGDRCSIIAGSRRS
jgi:hypothetical protein